MSAPRNKAVAALLGAAACVFALGCVDKAPPATWPEPPPPVMAKPVGGDAAPTPVAEAPDEPSAALEGTNDPKEGAVGLDEAPADEPPQAEAPEAEEKAAEPASEDRADAPAPNP